LMLNAGTMFLKRAAFAGGRRIITSAAFAAPSKQSVTWTSSQTNQRESKSTKINEINVNVNVPGQALLINFMVY